MFRSSWFFADFFKKIRFGEYMSSDYRKWLWFSPIGLCLTGLGFSMLGDAAFIKASAESFSDWFYYGTFSLVVINAGLCVFAEGVKYRVFYEWEKRQKAG